MGGPLVFRKNLKLTAGFIESQKKTIDQTKLMTRVSTKRKKDESSDSEEENFVESFNKRSIENVLDSSVDEKNINKKNVIKID